MTRPNMDLARFTRPRQEGDADYVKGITDILTELGHPEPQKWTQDPKITMAKDMPPAAQCVAVTKYWFFELGKMQRDTQSERYCLGEVDQDSADYLRLFKEHVGPTIAMVAKGELPADKVTEH